MSFRVRPATADDLQALYELAKLAGEGFTNLPSDKPTLAEKLRRSDEAFAREDPAEGDELFLMVLENTATGDVRDFARGLVEGARPALALYGPVTDAPDLDAMTARLAA